MIDDKSMLEGILVKLSIILSRLNLILLKSTLEIFCRLLDAEDEFVEIVSIIDVIFFSPSDVAPPTFCIDVLRERTLRFA